MSCFAGTDSRILRYAQCPALQALTRAFSAVRFTTMLQWWGYDTVLKATFNEKACELLDGDIIAVYVFTH